MPKLVEAIDTQGKRISVNLMKLNEYMTKGASLGGQKPTSMSAQAAREKYTKFDPKVRQILQQISEYLKRMNITLKQLFEKMDADGNGQLSRDEFVMSMP
jgi:Ca2+-binding EF-hand superfamily protein